MKPAYLLLAVVMLASSAATLPAQTPYARTPSKLNWVARFWGLGWSAGYHARSHATPTTQGVYGWGQVWGPMENMSAPALSPQPAPSDPAYLSTPLPTPTPDTGSPALNRGAAQGPLAPQERAASYGNRLR